MQKLTGDELDLTSNQPKIIEERPAMRNKFADANIRTGLQSKVLK